MRSKKEVKKRFLLNLFKLLKEGKYPSQIASKLKVSKQNINYYIRELKKQEVISKIGYGVWSVDETKVAQFLMEGKNLTLGTLQGKEEANLHALSIEMPIVEGKIDLYKRMDGYEQQALRGWKPSYKRIIRPIGLTIRNNNNKSLSVYIWSRKIFNTFEIHSLITKTFNYLYYIFKEKGVILSWDYRVSTLHLSIPAKDLTKIVNKGFKLEILLDRYTEKLTPRDKDQEAKAWVDSSPFLGIETNDIQYVRNKLLMPENIDKLTHTLIPVIQELAVNMKSHTKFVKSSAGVMQETKKMLEKINAKLSQKKMDEWL